MTVTCRRLEVRSESRPTFHDLTGDVRSIVARASIEHGIVVVSSPHTTCSVLIQEESHDRDFHGTEFLMRDLVDILERVAPTCRSEGQYRHPGPEHIRTAVEERDEEPWWSLNVDGHLRSALLGRSESIPVIGGEIALGEFGRVYFADFDQVRARSRTVNVVVMGE